MALGTRAWAWHKRKRSRPGIPERSRYIAKHGPFATMRAKDRRAGEVPLSNPAEMMVYISTQIMGNVRFGISKPISHRAMSLIIKIYQNHDTIVSGLIKTRETWLYLERLAELRQELRKQRGLSEKQKVIIIRSLLNRCGEQKAKQKGKGLQHKQGKYQGSKRRSKASHHKGR